MPVAIFAPACLDQSFQRLVRVFRQVECLKLVAQFAKVLIIARKRLRSCKLKEVCVLAMPPSTSFQKWRISGLAVPVTTDQTAVIKSI